MPPNGLIDRTELSSLLRRLDPDAWTPRRIDQLLSAFPGHDGQISQRDFVEWVQSNAEKTEHVKTMPACFSKSRKERKAESMSVKSEKGSRSTLDMGHPSRQRSIVEGHPCSAPDSPIPRSRVQEPDPCGAGEQGSALSGQGGTCTAQLVSDEHHVGMKAPSQAEDGCRNVQKACPPEQALNQSVVETVGEQSQRAVVGLNVGPTEVNTSCIVTNSSSNEVVGSASTVCAAAAFCDRLLFGIQEAKRNAKESTRHGAAAEMKAAEAQAQLRVESATVSRLLAENNALQSHVPQEKGQGKDDGGVSEKQLNRILLEKCTEANDLMASCDSLQKQAAKAMENVKDADARTMAARAAMKHLRAELQAMSAEQN